jgi:hypothetical protein
MFKNSSEEVRRIFRHKREEVKESWRKMTNEEFHNLYCLSIIFKMIKSRTVRWEGHIAHLGEMINVCKSLVKINEGKRPLGRPRCR